MEIRDYSAEEIIEFFEKKKKYAEQDLKHHLELDTSILDSEQKVIYHKNVGKLKEKIGIMQSTIDILENL